MVDLLPDDETTIEEFHFRKDDLKLLSIELWECFGDRFEGTFDRVKLPNRNYCHFETGILMMLYQLSYPRRLCPDIIV
jgi:hypothetical protein